MTGKIMKEKDYETVNIALAEYGACLTDDYRIQHNGKILGIKIKSDAKRFRFISADNEYKLASSPKTIEGVCKFVESFWYWKKVKT